MDVRRLLLAAATFALSALPLRADIVWTSTEGNVIETAQRNGANARTLVNLVSLTGNTNPEPRGITNDGTYLYWTDLGQNGAGVGAGIYRANYDGTGAVRLIDPVAALGGAVGDYSPEGIVIAAGKIYWTDFGKGAVYFADLDGGNAAAFATGVVSPRGITASAGRIFWQGQNARKIFSADEDGGNPAEFFNYVNDLSDVTSPWDIASDGINLYITDFGSRNLYSIQITNKTSTLIKENVDAFGVDYADGVLYFAVNSTNQLFSVATGGDNLTTLLTAPSGDARWVTVISPQPVPVAPTASVKANRTRILENSKRPLLFTISLNRTARSTLTIPYSIRGTARAGSDFTPRRTRGTVRIAAGRTKATVSLRMKNDRRKEKTKRIVMSLVKGSGFSVGRSATVTLVDDDK